MYSEKIQITSNDIDENLELRLSSLFKFMQQVASHHVEKLHAGHLDLLEHNMLWVVIRMQVKIYKLPKYEEEIVVSTHAGETRSFIYPRYFEIYDDKKNLIVAVSSLWTIIDATTRKVVLKPQGITPIKGESDKDDLPLPEKNHSYRY